MRFLIPNYCLPDSFVDNVAYTLRAMGHDVFTVPKPNALFDQRITHLSQMVNEKLWPNKLSFQEKWLIKNFKTIKPDIVLSLTQELSEAVLLELKKNNIFTVAWWGDTPSNMSRFGLLCDGWDLLFIKDKYAAFKLRTLNLNAHYLPEAMNPAWHQWNFTRINNDLLFAGNTYDYRHYLLRKLIAEKRYSIKLYGNRPPRWADPNLQDFYMKEYIVKEQKSLHFGSSLACINSTAMSEGNSMNCRAFEIAGAGGLQIMEYRSAIEDCFEPGKEILTYSSFDELKTLIDRVSNDPTFAMQVRKSAHQRANLEHRYEHRLKEIFKHLNIPCRSFIVSSKI